jgi:EPS-associated MarR family transcriptional regulator
MDKASGNISSPRERGVRTAIIQMPTLQEENHLKVLRLLEANPRVNQRDLASSMGISLGKANYCLKALVDKGWIKMQNFRNSQHKLGYAYLLTPSGIVQKADLTARFLLAKMAEYESLNQEIEALRRELGDIAAASDLASNADSRRN